MELCMAAQEDATPWEVPQQQNSSTTSQVGDEMPAAEMLLDGRAHFSLLGIVRRKPSRMDAESTRSKSCSDKLALRQVSSLLSCEASHLVAPTKNAYLAGLILPEDEISQVACDRSFSEKGRMQALAGRSWPETTDLEGTNPGYRFWPFRVLSVPSEEVAKLWRFAKPKSISPDVALDQNGDPSPSTAKTKKSKPGNASAVWAMAPYYRDHSAIFMEPGSKSLPTLCRSKTGLYETIINGVKQGNRASAPGARGASALSRARLWALFRNIATASASVRNGDDSEPLSQAPETEKLQVNSIHSMSGKNTYQEFKKPSGLEDPLSIRVQAISDAKIVLRGWQPNVGDESWGLDVLVDPKKRKR
jgi:tRNA-specific adenosine deaminase 1